MKSKLILAAILAGAVLLLTRPAESYESDYERRLNNAVERNQERIRQRLEQSYNQPAYQTSPQMIITPNGPAFIETDRNGNAFGYGPAFDNLNRGGFR